MHDDMTWAGDIPREAGAKTQRSEQDRRPTLKHSHDAHMDFWKIKEKERGKKHGKE